jgi:serine/threonine protein kinase
MLHTHTPPTQKKKKKKTQQPNNPTTQQPNSIMFADPGDVLGNTVKLSDFGLSKFVDLAPLGGPEGFQAAAAGRHTRLRAALKASMSGTPAYCAPERLDCDEQFETFAVDLWSLGCICYFMLCGIPPFYSDKEDEVEHDDEIAEMIFSGAVEFPVDRPISAQAKSFVLELLTQDPVARATALEASVHPWFQQHSGGGGGGGGGMFGPNGNGNSNDNGDVGMAAGPAFGVGPTSFPGGADMLKSSLNRVIDTQRDSNFSP